jgi:nitrogen fixation protein NifQ
MIADDAYRWLIAEEMDFDSHVLAAILALALVEAGDGMGTVGEAAGYGGLPDALAARFPHAAERLKAATVLERSPDEAAVFDLLWRGATSRTPFEHLLAGMVARRAQRPNHLWQDLGLRHRGELSQLMSVHFERLARRNTADMKWKKFFFRMICRDGDYGLCTAPSCGECCDFDNCFGSEDGEAFLAHLRRGAETGTP